MAGAVALALLLGLAGCQVNDAAVVKAVQDSYFEGFEEKTIGECFEWFGSTNDIEITWFSEVKKNAPAEITLGASDKIVVCRISSDGYASNYGFSYNAKNKITLPLYAQSIDPDGEILQEMTDIDELNEMYGYLTQLIQYSGGMSFGDDDFDYEDYDFEDYDFEDFDFGDDVDDHEGHDHD